MCVQQTQASAPDDELAMLETTVRRLTMGQCCGKASQSGKKTGCAPGPETAAESLGAVHSCWGGSKGASLAPPLPP